MDEATAKAMLELAHTNMSAIIPSGKSKAEDDALWWESFEKGLREGTRHILQFEGGGLRGFLSYTVRRGRGDVYVNEVQIHPESQRRGVVLRHLVAEFLGAAGAAKVRSIRTYANRLNQRSQELCEKMGFSVEGQTERGIRYRVGKRELMKRLRRFESQAK